MVLKKVYYPDSQDVEAEWEELPDGRAHGKYWTYHRNGKVARTGENHYGKENGLWREYDENGNEVRQVKWEDGIKKSSKEFDENHNLKEEHKYDENGKTEFRITYKSGIKRSESQYQGSKIIARTLYDEHGDIEHKFYVDENGVDHIRGYKNGRFVQDTLTYPDGTMAYTTPESPIVKIFQEGQKKAQTRDTAVRMSARKSIGRK